MVDGVVVDGRPLNLFLSLFFSACPVLLFATLREEEPCICLREREKDHSFAYSSAMSSRKKEKKKSHSAVLSLLFSPWVRSLSFFFFSTRFSFVLWGQCNEIRSYPIRSVPPLLLKENNKTKDGRIRKFLFIFKHLSSGQKIEFRGKLKFVGDTFWKSERQRSCPVYYCCDYWWPYFSRLAQQTNDAMHVVAGYQL